MDKKAVLTAVILYLLVSLFGCMTNPVTGEKEIMLVSNEQEKEIGKATDRQVIQQYGIYPDERLQNYVKSIGEQTVPHSHRPELDYRFRVVDSEAVNAFAVPGGYVYFTRGILAYFNNEAQLAGVMAHEIGHIVARHSAQLITRAQLAQLGLGIGAILSEDFRKYAGLASLGVQLLFLKFSRDDERQADELGTEYATKLGYDTRELADFFGTLARLNPGDTGGLPGWFSTHPDPEDRVVAVKEDTEKWQQKVLRDRFSVERDQYLKKIDGIVFGANPRHGFEEKGTFYHPDFRFKFPVPANWSLVNSAAQVQMVSPDQDAAVLLLLAEESDPRSAASKFIQNSEASVLSEDDVDVNGMPAVRLMSDIQSEQNQLRVLSYFIQKDGRVFVFHGYTYRSRFDGYRGSFQNTMGNFDHLRDRKILNVQPDRIKIRSAPSDGSVRQALIALGTPEKELESLAVLNGMSLDDSIKKGTLLKTVLRR